MSRTRKGTKPPGFEYWSKRPANKGGATVGRFTKRRTHRLERRWKPDPPDPYDLNESPGFAGQRKPLT